MKIGNLEIPKWAVGFTIIIAFFEPLPFIGLLGFALIEKYVLTQKTDTPKQIEEVKEDGIQDDKG